MCIRDSYIKTGDPRRLAGLLAEFLAARGIDPDGGPALERIVATLQERARTLVEMADGAAFYYAAEVDYDPEAAAKFLTEDRRAVLEKLVDGLQDSPSFDESAVEAKVQAVLTETGWKLGKVGPAIRVALTGGTASPGIYEMMAVLGRQETLRRLRRALAHLA
jgi:glutamyl-tRNA synthetase